MQPLHQYAKLGAPNTWINGKAISEIEPNVLVRTLSPILAYQNYARCVGVTLLVVNKNDVSVRKIQIPSAFLVQERVKVVKLF